MTTTEQLVTAADLGDHDAFRRLLEPHRAELHAHCYRLLGSLHDADDALQDTLVRSWLALSRFERGRPVRPWLYRIATNVCLDAIRRRRTLPESHALEPYPDELLGPEASYEQRESVELAFVAALQRLPPRQRAALILRDVLGFSAREVATALELTPAAVNSALQRARISIQQRLPARSQQATLRSLGDERLAALVQRYISAWERRDVDELVTILAEDVTFAMPPDPGFYCGRDAVLAFITGTGRPDLLARPALANFQPAIAWYLRSSPSEPYRPASVEVLGIRGGRIHEITAFASPRVLARICVHGRVTYSANGENGPGS